MKALILAETNSTSKGLCDAARIFADEVLLAWLGGEAPSVAADTVCLIDVPDDQPVENAYETLASLCDEQQPDLIIAESTRRMKALAGQLAALNGTSVITDAVTFTEQEVSNRYFGGLAVKAQHAEGPITIITAMPNAFPGAEDAAVDRAPNIRSIEWVEPVGAPRRREVRDLPSQGIDLEACDTVVAAGRGFSERDQLGWANELCEKIGAGLGCTRPLTEGVDWLPRETYIGVSGLMLAPKTYLGIGISGQMQHMVGVNRADTVFAINKDKNAAIFKQCDYGLVGDIKDVLPALNAVL